MPPKVKITKEDIIKTALELVRNKGTEALNARSVAAELNCSTQPVFSNFATMDELQNALDGRKMMYIPSTAADCCEDTDAVEAFDATFPEKEKKWMPSQEEFYIYSHSSVVR